MSKNTTVVVMLFCYVHDHTDMVDDSERQFHKEILLGYCFVIFGIISALNAQMALWNFGWFGRGGASLPSIISNIDFNNIEVWYFFAGAIFFVIHIIFIGFFMHSYLKEKVEVKTRSRTILEVFYLSWVGSFSVIALHVPRIILTFFAKIDPEYSFQEKFMNNTLHLKMADWNLSEKFVNAEPRIHELALYGTLVVMTYFAILLFLHYIRHWNPSISK